MTRTKFARGEWGSGRRTVKVGCLQSGPEVGIGAAVGVGEVVNERGDIGAALSCGCTHGKLTSVHWCQDKLTQEKPRSFLSRSRKITPRR